MVGSDTKWSTSNAIAMRFSHAVVIVLALQVQACQAFLGNWFSSLWNNIIKPIGEKVVNFVTGAWDAVKRTAVSIYESVKEAILKAVADVKEWGETDWDCGADNFWPSKVAAKVLAHIDCTRVYGEEIEIEEKHVQRCDIALLSCN
ncbi:hypothetical protein Y032_0009g388 [Ancylostoma ceylanicum]|uniref:Uncharacterized protein n=1 Tax=Ancylostoma ceylanicum TaxID=53326 RepID=A0A016VII6_9BILA|nr:hypothetical protein Y032_0009g388 [Ancylostoma ceylanicum]